MVCLREEESFVCWGGNKASYGGEEERKPAAAPVLLFYSFFNSTVNIAGTLHVAKHWLRLHCLSYLKVAT